MKPIEPKSIPKSAEYFFAVLVIGLGVWQTSIGLEKVMDIRFYDESYYLTQGIFHPIKIWLADYSAFYSLYYKAFSFFFNNQPIDVYYANYRFWAFLLAIVVFFTLRVSKLNFWLCLIWALCSLSAEVNYTLWPKAGHLAMFGVFSGVLGLNILKEKPLSSLVWVTGICLLFSWCRPEFILGAVSGTILLFLWGLLKRNDQTNFKDFWVLIPWILGFGFWVIWGLPIGNTGRGMVAFGQHYVHNWRNFSGNNAGDLMWDWVNWRTQFGLDFGNSQSVFSAMVENPKAFFSHIWFNLKYMVYKCFIYFFETLLPNRWLGLQVTGSIAFSWIALEYFHGFNGLSTWWTGFKIALNKYWAHFLVLSVPSIAAGILFQPRPHYILPLFPIFLAFVAPIVRQYSFPTLKASYKNASGAILLLLCLFFLPEANAYFQLRNQKIKDKNAETAPSQFNHFEVVTTDGLKQKELIETLVSLPWKKGTRIFDASTGATEYLGTQLIQTGKTGFEMDYKKLSDFGLFLKNEKVDAVFLRSSIYYDRFFSSQKSWQLLRSNPEKMGWKKRAIGGQKDSIFINQNGNGVFESDNSIQQY